MGAAAVAHIKY